MNGLQAKDHNGQTVVDSRDVAAMLERNHRELLKSIRTQIGYLNEGNFAPVEFFIESMYQDSKGETRPCYLITKKGCDMIANKTLGKKGTLFTAAYVTAFEEMSRKLGETIAPVCNLANGVSFNGLARLISVTRRVMLDMGSTAVEIGAMTKSLYDTSGIPLPVAFTKQIPGQLCLFDTPTLK